MKLLEIKKLYSKKDKMHNWNHILRIRRNVKVLMKPYKNVDKKMLNFIVSFHGLKEYVKKNKSEFPEYYVRAVLRHNKNARSTEEKIVFDANMLDNLGKDGIKKALYVGMHLGRSKKEAHNYLRENLKKARFYTKSGKKMGRMKIKEMKEILR